MSDADPHSIKKQIWRRGELIFLEAIRVRAAGSIEQADALDQVARRHAYLHSCESIIKIFEMNRP